MKSGRRCPICHGRGAIGTFSNGFFEPLDECIDCRGTGKVPDKTDCAICGTELDLSRAHIRMDLAFFKSNSSPKGREKSFRIHKACSKNLRMNSDPVAVMVREHAAKYINLLETYGDDKKSDKRLAGFLGDVLWTACCQAELAGGVAGMSAESLVSLVNRRVVYLIKKMRESNGTFEE